MKIPVFVVSLFLLFSSAFAVLEIPNAQPKIGAEQWKQVLDSTWKGLKRRNIDAYSTGLVHRPKSETPGDAVSEGVGYGMLLALYANDQEYFDKIFKAGKQYSLNACQNWRVNKNGSNAGYGSASDADEDIAAALVLAAKLLEKNKWNNTGVNYGNEARSAVNCVRGQLSGDGNDPRDGALKPGNGWGWDVYNPGYFAPAWFRVFKTFDTENAATWEQAARRSYDLIAMNPGFSKGLVPDWMDGEGRVLDGGPGYNAYLKGQEFFKDAIRMLWRVATDVIWFPNEHPENSTGKTYLKNAMNFITSKGGPSAANFYRLNGELLPAGDIWREFNNETDQNTWRYRQEHSHLTVGQWSQVAMAVGTDDDKKAWSSEMAKFYDWENKVDFFGLAEDPNSRYEDTRREDTTHNEMYFDQFLAWFGVSLMSGTWINVVDVLNNTVPNNEGLPDLPWPPPPPPSSSSDLSSSSEPQPSSSSQQTEAIIKLHQFEKIGAQISKIGNALHLISQSDANWKIYNLQGKLLFSSKSKEAVWNMGNFKGVAVVSIRQNSKTEQKLIMLR